MITDTITDLERMPLEELNLLQHELRKEKLTFNLEIDKKTAKRVTAEIKRRYLERNLRFNF